MYSTVTTLVGNGTWMVILPTVLFLWRRKSTGTGSTENGRPTKKRPGTDGNWLYVGRDEDGTPFYLDIETLSRESGNAVKVRMWVKYKPAKGSAAFLNAESFLQAAGRSHEPFEHIRQRLEIDFTKNLVRDLELVFHAPDGRAIDSVEYRTPELKKITPGSLHELLKKTAEGAWSPDRFPGDPELRVKLQEKLKEINEAFEAFETTGE